MFCSLEFIQLPIQRWDVNDMKHANNKVKYTNDELCNSTRFYNVTNQILSARQMIQPWIGQMVQKSKIGKGSLSEGAMSYFDP